MDRALEAEQREEEEDFLTSQGPLYPDSVPSCPPITQEEDEEKEEEDCVSMEVEPSTQHQQQSSRDQLQSQETHGLIHGWDEVAVDHVVLSDPEDSAPNASANLRCMASLILQSLWKDPRIRAIKERDHFFSAQPQGMTGSSNHRQRLFYMVQEYLGARSDLEIFPTENPLGYWS